MHNAEEVDMRKMSYMTAIMLNILLFLPSATAQSQDEATVFDRYSNAVGVYVNSLQVYGLTYQKWTGKVGYQIAGGGNYRPTEQYGDLFRYSIQAGMMYSLYKEEFAEWFTGGLFLFGMVGQQGWRSFTTMSIDTKNIDAGYQVTSVLGPYQPAIIAGIGIGFEAVLFRHFSNEVQLMYTGRFLSDPTIDFGVGWSFRYRF